MHTLSLCVHTIMTKNESITTSKKLTTTIHLKADTLYEHTKVSLKQNTLTIIFHKKNWSILVNLGAEPITCLKVDLEEECPSGGILLSLVVP